MFVYRVLAVKTQLQQHTDDDTVVVFIDDVSSSNSRDGASAK